MFFRKLRYCTGSGRSSPHSARMRSRSSAGAPGSAITVTGSPVSLITVKMVRLRMNRVTMAYSVLRMMNLPMKTLARRLVQVGSGLQLDVLPRIGVAGRDRRKNVLPFRCLDPRPIGVDEGLAEHRHDIVVFQHRRLNFIG